MPIVPLTFPIGGLNRGNLYQSQPPYTTLAANNVRPRQLIEKRWGGGVRGGFGRAFHDQIGSGNPVRMLASVGVVETEGADAINDHFDGYALSSNWTPTGDYLFTRRTLIGAAAGSNASLTGAALDVASAYGYQVAVYIVPDAGKSAATYRLACRLNDSAPDVVADSVYVDLQLEPAGNFFYNVVVKKAGSPTVLATGTGDHTYDHPGWLTLEIFRDDGADGDREHIRAYWRGTTLHDGYINHAGDPVTSMPSYATHRRPYLYFAGDDRRALVDQFRVRIQYRPQSSGSGAIRRRRQLLMAACNGALYVNNAMGRLEVASSQSNLQSDRRLYASELTQKLYIADNGPILLDHFDSQGGTYDGSVTGQVDLSVTNDPYDFLALGVDANVHVVEIYRSADDDAIVGVYPIATVLQHHLLLGYNIGHVATSAVRFRIVRGPKVYDPLAGTFTVLKAKASNTTAPLVHGSSQPINAKITCVFRDRLGFGRTDEAPHAFYFSRVGDPTDWDYDVSDTDPERAFAGTTIIGGQLSRAMTAMFAHNNDYCILATAVTMHITRGDPTAGGQTDIYSETEGVVAPGAWCKIPGEAVCVLSQEGVLLIPPGAQGTPQKMSKQPLPADLQGITYPEYEVSMAYSVEDEGVEIWVRNRAGSPVSSWFFHIMSGGFWPMSVERSALQPESILRYVADVGDDSAVLFGGQDGFIRRLRDVFHNDDGAPISAFVDYGPLRLGSGPLHDAAIHSMVVTLNRDGGSADWSVRTGNYEQEAAGARPSVRGTARAGLNPARAVRARTPAVIRFEAGGGSMLTESGDMFVYESGGLMLGEADADALPWSIEGVVVDPALVGLHRTP